MPQLVKKSEVAYFYGSNQQSGYLSRMFPTSWTATTAYATAEEVWGKVSAYTMLYGMSFNGPQDNRYITGLTNTNPITCATDCKRFTNCLTQSTTACTSFRCSYDSCSKDTCSKEGLCGTDCTKYTPCPSFCYLDGVCLSDCPSKCTCEDDCSSDCPSKCTCEDYCSSDCPSKCTCEDDCPIECSSQVTPCDCETCYGGCDCDDDCSSECSSECTNKYVCPSLTCPCDGAGILCDCDSTDVEPCTLDACTVVTCNIYCESDSVCPSDDCTVYSWRCPPYTS